MGRKKQLGKAILEAGHLDASLFPEKTREQVILKLTEELGELANHTDYLNEVEELGDVLFLVISYCRIANILFETALLSAMVKIKDRKKRKNG
jgi:NTP pyrophosphatase (non-canonical NTP hydrolase)